MKTLKRVSLSMLAVFAITTFGGCGKCHSCCDESTTKAPVAKEKTEKAAVDQKTKSEIR
jgi:hypothetical protein